MHSLASREARVTLDRILRPDRRIRVALQLGFFVSALAGCSPPDPHAVARADDARYRTTIFTWLLDHEPSAVVTWRVPVDTVRALLPQSRVTPAGATKVCSQAARSHALLLLVESRSERPDWDIAEDCGFALARDDGGIAVAPR